jgi:hypothetical protein
MDYLVFIIADSVSNSVFEGQILLPLLKRLNDNPYLSIALVSFEQNKVSKTTIQRINKEHPRLLLHIHYRYQFWGNWSLKRSIEKLQTITSHLKNYTIIARGLLAGSIAQQIKLDSCSQLIIQVRGLLHQEYWYIHKNKSLLKPVYWLRMHLYKNLETSIYKRNIQKTHFSVVSIALKNYIIEQYHIAKNAISIEQTDFPKRINKINHQIIRTQFREKLQLHKKTVFVYLGSAHSWQCPEKTILFFKEQLEKDIHSFLLIISKDTKPFQILLKKHTLSKTSFKLISIGHTQVKNYLCAADYGLLFREAELINWVSRPTKAIEYWAARLPIIHNNTIHFMHKLSSNKSNSSINPS